MFEEAFIKLLYLKSSSIALQLSIIILLLEIIIELFFLTNLIRLSVDLFVAYKTLSYKANGYIKHSYKKRIVT